MNERLQETYKAARAYLLVKARFDDTYRGWWVNDVKPCDDEIGFRILREFAAEVETYYFGYERHDVGVKHAANEIFRQVATNQSNNTYEQVCGFVKWYERIANRIGRCIDHLWDFHGDGFGDLCDSLPLAGEEIVKRCLATNKKKPSREGFLSEEEIHQAIKDAPNLGEKWCKFIMEGENYVEMALSDQAKKWFVHNLRGEHIPGQEPFSEEEQELLSHLDDDD